MLPDSKWIDAVKLPTRVMLGLFIACLVLLGMDRSGILDLATFGNLTKPLLLVGAVLSGSLSLTGIGAFVVSQLSWGKRQSLLSVRRQIRSKELEDGRAKAQRAVLERLDFLCAEELRYVADCLREGSQSFYTWVHSPHAATLVSKGIVSSPGGTHHQDHYPFSIVDFVWKELLDKKAEIIARDDENRKREEQQRRGRR